MAESSATDGTRTPRPRSALSYSAPGSAGTTPGNSGGTTVFGRVGTAMNVLPRWTLTTEPHKKPPYSRRVALEVAKRAGELRRLLGVR